jgi:2'-5' RNA ligase
MSETIRSFIAFELPDDVLSSLEKLQNDLGSYGFPVRWVRPAGIHLTLKFLGDIKAAQIERIAGAIFEAGARHAPLSLAAKGIGVFPGIKRPRVIWSGLAGQLNLLGDLQQKLEGGLAEIGFTKEKRSFNGHLTLGRFKARVDSNQLMQALHEFEKFETATFAANPLILYRSELKPSGAVYSKLKTVSLQP